MPKPKIETVDQALAALEIVIKRRFQPRNSLEVFMFLFEHLLGQESLGTSPGPADDIKVLRESIAALTARLEKLEASAAGTTLKPIKGEAVITVPDKPKAAKKKPAKKKPTPQDTDDI